jgi:tetratricopeptide (TPR) repeat protein
VALISSRNLLLVTIFIFVAGAFGTPECLAEENSRSLILRGEKLHKSGQYQEAVQTFQQAIQIDPASEEAYLNLGNSHYELGSYASADDTFRHVIKINPTNSTALFYLGLSLSQQKKYVESIPYFNKAGMLDSDFEQLSLFYIGRAHSETGDPQKAIEIWERAIEVDPTTDIAKKTEALMGKMTQEKVRKPWAVSMSTGIEFDDNVTVSAADLSSGEGDHAYIFEFSGAYRLLETQKINLEASYDFYQSIYDTFSEFDLQSHIFSLGGTYKFQDFDTDVFASYNRNTLGGEDFLEVFTIAPQVGFFPAERWFTVIRYSYEDSRFFNDPARDGKNHGVGTDNFVFFMQGKSHFLLSYRFEDKTTLGDEFTYAGHFATIGLKTPLPFWNRRGTFNLAYKYFYKDYENITPSIGEVRQDYRHTIQVRVTQSLNSWLQLNLNYDFIDSVSNLKSVDFTENIASFAFNVFF